MGRPVRPGRRGVAATTANVAVGLTLALTVSSYATDGARLVAVGVGAIPAVALEQRGVYLGPPGKLPAGVPMCQVTTPPTTTGAGTTGSSLPALGSEQQAVQGDPADGRATVSSTSAEVTALAKTGGFVGTPDAGVPVLVQLEDIYACITATAWAIQLTGMMQLSCGPPPTDGATAPPCTPHPSTAVAFVDAVTRQLITEVAFSPSPS